MEQLVSVFDIKTSINDIFTTIIVDTGTSLNIIGGNFFNSYFRTIAPLLLPKNTKVTAANEQLMTVREKAQFKVNLSAKWSFFTFILWKR
jgi:hypothetical protein